MMASSDKKQLKCPSSLPSLSSELFGIVSDEGKVIYLPKPLKVNNEFIDSVSENYAPDKKFRFTSKCVESGCNHWNGESKVCSLTKRIISNFKKTSQALPKCAIREVCKWFDQEGEIACNGCSFVRRLY